MRIRCSSLMIGRREMLAHLRVEGGKPFLVGEGYGLITPDDYTRHGFRIIEASRDELEGMVAGGYESPRVHLRFYDIENKDEDQR